MLFYKPRFNLKIIEFIDMSQKIQGSDKKWEHNHPNYASTDSLAQTFFYTLSNMLKLQEAKNILQVGCGAGKLLSTVLDLKNPEATYLATDLSEGMVNQSKKRLQAHFDKYESKLTFQQWLKKQGLSFDIQNGEDIVPTDNIKFDRIIANMVICHADNPDKMLRSWHQSATSDCLLGISLLGDPIKNQFIRAKREAIEEAGQKIQTRPPYYWYDKISKIVQNQGWQILLDWQQNSTFPFLEFSQTNSNPHFKHMIEKGVPEAARQNFTKKIKKMMEEDKTGIQVWSKVIVARKKASQ